ncbi:efflux RND transporter periplasmic adaptor subunit [Robiginitalea aurantiaca]|uniref:Efflux RND transporter periplasmic adaptor subunit n=1 Tax=Robiginitalea aurantiaca TaxID=3056915 RepID=A0ABT7WCP8_9FLAO|nr:efflux RND transporter periplasmic adaptor subunit [Robiginitalea aurantiaca]MDM9630696.1 efflux RND transporter periplasmic adaptor subunit [Robiginitalea aurantiaca]
MDRILNIRPSFLVQGISALVFFTLSTSCKQKEPQGAQSARDITVFEAKQQDVPIYDELVGQIYGQKDIPIRARVDGYLQKISFEEGSRVKKGQLLYSIDPDPYLAEVAAKESLLAEARTLMVNAKNELDRYIPLAEMNAVSQSDLDGAQAAYDASRANVDAARANLKQSQIQLGYCSIKAPIDGLIGATEAREGEYVGRNPNPVILNTLSRIDTIRVQFSISEAKYLELARAYSKGKSDEEVTRDVQEGRLEPNIELILADGSHFEEKGSIDFVNSQINSSTGSLLIQASFPNSSRILRPGLYAKVRLQMSVAEGAIVIPQRCLTELQGQYSVMVADPNNTIESRAVQIGRKIGDMVIIEDGVQAGDKVVIDALQKVQAGMKVNPVPTEFESKTTL